MSFQHRAKDQGPGHPELSKLPDPYAATDPEKVDLDIQDWFRRMCSQNSRFLKNPTSVQLDHIKKIKEVVVKMTAEFNMHLIEDDHGPGKYFQFMVLCVHA
jgi:hypothetical protein